MNDFLFFFVNHWLNDFMNMLLVDDWLMEFMNDRLMSLVDYFPMSLINDILMMFMNNFLMSLLDNRCLLMNFHDRSILMFNDFGFLKSFIYNSGLSM